MIRYARLRLWLAVLDAAHWLRAPRPVYLWVVGRCAACVDYDELTDEPGEWPW